MAKVIAIANQKGGCGKTSVAANLGIGLAMAGKKVCLLGNEFLQGEFARAGIESEQTQQKSELTTADLFAAGLTGKPDSAARRRKLLAKLKLPQRLSNRTMLTMLCMMLTREEFFELAASIE